MNPNSGNQLWSKWTFFVQPEKRIPFNVVKLNCAKFGRKVFGSATEMQIIQTEDGWEVKVRTEGAPVHDSAYSAWMHQQWVKFFQSGFGEKTVIHSTHKLEAGSRQDGTPSDQLIIVPSIEIPELKNK